LDLVINWSRFIPYYAGYAHQILINDGFGNFRDETHHRLRSIPEFEAPVEQQSWSDLFEFIDVNGDGHLDLIGTHRGYWIDDRFNPPDRVRLWLNNGAGIFSEVPVEKIDVGTTPIDSFLGWGDFSGDGRFETLSLGQRWTDNIGTAQRIIFTHWEFDRKIR
jgi:hypothetical protein